MRTGEQSVLNDDDGRRLASPLGVRGLVTSSNKSVVGSESDAVAEPACDGDKVGISRSVVALPMDCATPRDHGTIGSESGAVITATRDGDEVGIRRSIAALTLARVTPSDHGTVGSESDAVMPPTRDGDEVGIRRGVVALSHIQHQSDQCAQPRQRLRGPSKIDYCRPRASVGGPARSVKDRLAV